MKLKAASICFSRNLLILTCIVLLFSFFINVLYKIFVYNIAINSVIFSCITFGILLIFSKIFKYDKEYAALLHFQQLTNAKLKELSILKPLALRISRTNNLISHTQVQIILDGIEKKNIEILSVPRYIANTLIFLGLLGTFWGLSHTIGNVAGIIDKLGVDEADVMTSFTNLKESLRIPLLGMGTAFGCSLFALVGSIILGVMVMNLKKLGEDFADKVEEWLADYTISFSLAEENMNYHGELFSMGLLEKTIETIYSFQNQIHVLETMRSDVMSMQAEISKNLLKISEQLNATTGLVKLEQRLDNITEKLGNIASIIEKNTQSETLDRNEVAQAIQNEIRIIAKILSNMAK